MRPSRKAEAGRFATRFLAQPRQRGPASVRVRICVFCCWPCCPLHVACVQLESAHVQQPMRRLQSDAKHFLFLVLVEIMTIGRIRDIVKPNSANHEKVS